MSEVDTTVVPVEAVDGEIDSMRLRSFVGLILGLVGPRAYLATAGILLTLLVSYRTGANAFAITFALGANRLIGWLAYPILGRASDRTSGRAGRRAPYMAVGLLVMGVCTYGFTLLQGYWPLVALIAAVRVAYTVSISSNIAVVPETFGKSRALKAAAIIGVLGTALGFFIKVTVIATWKQNHPSTYNLPFRLAGVIMIVVAVLVILLVREAPATKVVAERDRTRHRSGLDELRDLLSAPNGKPLLIAVFLFWAGLTSTGNLAIVYFQKVLHAGASTQTIFGWATGVPALMVGLPIGWVISRVFTRKQVAITTPFLGAGLSIAQYFAHNIWQSVALAFIGAPLFSAFVISLAPMLLQLLPRSGGFGELLGRLWAPFSLFAVVFSFAAAYAVHTTGNYRVIWIFPAVGGVLEAIVMCFLWVPKGQERPNFHGLFDRFVDSTYRQVFERDRRLFVGTVTVDDADGASLFAQARLLLGNPYETAAADADRPHDDGVATDVMEGRSEAPEISAEAGAPAPADGGGEDTAPATADGGGEGPPG